VYALRRNYKENPIMAQQGSGGRGFAGMDPEKQRQIASEGGKAAHEKGTAHEFNSESARVAGQKGGEVVSRDRSHMAEIGRKGGEARGANSQRGGSSEQQAREGSEPHKNR
jgi:general stress protein YciG